MESQLPGRQRRAAAAKKKPLHDEEALALDARSDAEVELHQRACCRLFVRTAGSAIGGRVPSLPILAFGVGRSSRATRSFTSS
jgi:hypothetical protein